MQIEDFVGFDWSKKNYINFFANGISGNDGNSTNNDSETHIEWLKSKPFRVDEPQPKISILG